MRSGSKKSAELPWSKTYTASKLFAYRAIEAACGSRKVERSAQAPGHPVGAAGNRGAGAKSFARNTRAEQSAERFAQRLSIESQVPKRKCMTSPSATT
jgi:hypothetical protein